jgi:hypothetical protein
MRPFGLVFFVLSMVLLRALPSHAASSRQSRTVDLRGVLCEPEDQQLNNPLAGVDFVTNDDLVVYTVCRTNVALSLRDRFQPTDPNHLKAVIVDISTGGIKQKFDWPTHGHGSSVRVTHSGELLVRRDNFLQTLTPEGKSLHALRVVKVGLYDLVMVEVSPAIDPVAVTEISNTPGTDPLVGVAVLDSRSLMLLTQWHDTGDIWTLNASDRTVVGTSLKSTILESRGIEESTWSTIWKQAQPFDFRTRFLKDSAFAVVTGHSVVLFTSSGSLTGQIERPNARNVDVSRDGNVLGAVWAEFSGLDFATGRPVCDDAGTEIYQLTPLRRTASIDFHPVPAYGFDVALSPTGSRLALIDRMRLTVFEVAPN